MDIPSDSEGKEKRELLTCYVNTRKDMADVMEKVDESIMGFWTPDKYEHYVPLAKYCMDCGRRLSYHRFGSSQEPIKLKFPTVVYNWLGNYLENEQAHRRYLLIQQAADEGYSEDDVESILDSLMLQKCKIQELPKNIPRKELEEFDHVNSILNIMKAANEKCGQVPQFYRSVGDWLGGADRVKTLYWCLLDYKIRTLCNNNLRSEAHVFKMVTSNYIVELGMIECVMETIRQWFQDSVDDICFDCSQKTTKKN